LTIYVIRRMEGALSHPLWIAYCLAK
jgi:hypothetical protein